MDVLGDGVLKFICCRLTVDGDIPDDSPIEAFLSSHVHNACILRILPHGRAKPDPLKLVCCFHTPLHVYSYEAFFEKLKAMNNLHFK